MRPSSERAWFSGRVRFLRVLLGLGQETVAERSGLNISTVRLIERGRVAPSIDTARMLARGLGVRLTYLVGSEHPPVIADEIRLLVASLHGKPPHVVRLIVRAAQAIADECDTMISESLVADLDRSDDAH